MPSIERVALLVALGALAALAGCVGSTQPAVDVRSTEARLGAEGRTNNGPATWWWEYSEVRKRVLNGQGIKTPTQGPASSPTDVQLSWRLTGLDEAQRYYFRACGRDQAAGSQPQCGDTLPFKTAPGDSRVVIQDASLIRYDAGATAQHDVNAINDGPAVRFIERHYPDDPPRGSVLLSDHTCSTILNPGLAYADEAECDTQNPPALLAYLSPLGNKLSVRGMPVTAYGGAERDAIIAENTTLSGFADSLYGRGGNDQLLSFAGADEIEGNAGNDEIVAGHDGDLVYGGDGADLIYGDGRNPGSGESGVDYLYGEAGDDVLYGGPGQDYFYCGPGNDTAYINLAEFPQTYDCENILSE